MKIGLISNIYNPVGPSVSGGLEVFNYYLAKELNDLGQGISLYASGDSEKVEYLKPIIGESFSKRDDSFLSNPWNNRKITVEEFAIYTQLVQNGLKNEQIVHFSLVNFLPIYLAVKNGLKIVTTLHMPVTNYHYQTLLKLLTQEELNRVHFVGISKSQIKNFSPVSEVIYNGVDTNEFSYSEKFRNVFIWMGRIIPEKGAKDAIIAANDAKINLELAGAPKAINEKEYFEKEMKPNFTDFICYKGFMKKNSRRQFYRAKALLFPAKWEEAFGLTMIEALSSGTPVIAYDRGAVREVIKNGETGFIVPRDDVNALSKAMNKINSLPSKEYAKMRRNCRQSVEKYFSMKIMAKKYQELYKKIYKNEL